MFEELNQHRAAVEEQIQKGFEIGFTGGELEKAHNVGDIHPNGKWVWTRLPSGRYDWRVIKKTGAGSGGSAPATAQEKKEDRITISPNHPALGALKGVNAMKEYLTTFNSKYTDMSKVEVIKTPKGNWGVYYDGDRLGIFAGDKVPEGTAKKMGWLRTDSKDLTRSKRDAKIANLPVGTVVSGGGYKYVKRGEDHWVELSKKPTGGYKESTVARMDDDVASLQDFDDFKVEKDGDEKKEGGVTQKKNETNAEAGIRIFNSLSKEKQGILLGKLKKESERFLKNGMKLNEIIGEVEEYRDNNIDFDEEMFDIARDLGVKHNEAYWVMKHAANLEIKRLEGLANDKKES